LRGEGKAEKVNSESEDLIFSFAQLESEEMRIKERGKEVAVEKIGNPNGIFVNICGVSQTRSVPDLP
jgi:hypothetical protein